MSRSWSGRLRERGCGSETALRGYRLIELTDSLSEGDLAGALESSLGAAMEGAPRHGRGHREKRGAIGCDCKIRHSVSEAHKKGGVSVSHDTSCRYRLSAEVRRRIRTARPRPLSRRPFPLRPARRRRQHSLHRAPARARFSGADAFERAAAFVNEIIYDLASELGGSTSAARHRPHPSSSCLNTKTRSRCKSCAASIACSTPRNS
jgi:hypothetical protein